MLCPFLSARCHTVSSHSIIAHPSNKYYQSCFVLYSSFWFEKCPSSTYASLVLYRFTFVPHTLPDARISNYLHFPLMISNYVIPLYSSFNRSRVWESSGRKTSFASQA